ncbi:hypothetical protein DL546_000983 [Coniochaeta pulveracea]|uniref:BHLH domain-containing protein n=1 Tax=Coniochaeta pulveracea TaxID=177199 RepID=A0A420Y725_9PEZI|nr:hypothetical protein DL546_000983 [Coniochaeta pulveracea]
MSEYSSPGENAFLATGTNGAQALAQDEKPRLTEEEKKKNHIASEQKRRQAIREGFDKLTEIVPGIEGQGRSEGIVLQATVNYSREQIEERRRLIHMIESNGGTVDENLKAYLAWAEQRERELEEQARKKGGSNGTRRKV